MATNNRKCFCDGTSGTDCFWCQGTGYIIERLPLNTSKSPLTSSKEQVKLNPVNPKFIAKNERTNQLKNRVKRIAKILNSIRKSDVKKKILAPPAVSTKKELSEDSSANKRVFNVAKSQGKYAACENCGAKLNVKNVFKHKRKCKALNNGNTASKDSEFVKSPSKTTKSQNPSVIMSINNPVPTLPINKNADDKRSIVTCEFCKVKIKANNLSKHKKKCPAINRNATRKSSDNNFIIGRRKLIDPNRSSKDTPVGKPIIKPDIEVSDSRREYKQERQLDGSREFYKFRERGKFGSHSLYDDMGDEANP